MAIQVIGELVVAGRECFGTADRAFGFENDGLTDPGTYITAYYPTAEVVVARGFQRAGALFSLDHRPMAEVYDVTVKGQDIPQSLFVRQVRDRAGVLPLPFFERRAARAIRKAETIASQTK